MSEKRSSLTLDMGTEELKFNLKNIDGNPNLEAGQ